jgi:hypothetical protein
MNKILMMIMVVAFVVGCDEPTITAYDAGADAHRAFSDNIYRTDIISPVFHRSE